MQPLLRCLDCPAGCGVGSRHASMPPPHVSHYRVHHASPRLPEVCNYLDKDSRRPLHLSLPPWRCYTTQDL